MARKIRAREVLRLLESGMSRNAIARSQGMSKHSVQAVSEAAEAAGIGWVEAKGMSDAEAYAALFPEKVRDRDVYPDPDWERVHRELARVGVTLKRLHEELNHHHGPHRPRRRMGRHGRDEHEEEAGRRLGLELLCGRRPRCRPMPRPVPIRNAAGAESR